MPHRILWSCLLAGCATTPAKVAETARHLTVTCERNDWLTMIAATDMAPSAVVPAVEPASSRRLEVAAFAVQSPVDGDPIDVAVAFIASTTGAPFRGASALVHGLRVLAPPRSTQWLQSEHGAAAAVPVGTAVAVLAPTLTTRIGLHDLPLPDVIATLAGSTLHLAFAARPGSNGADELVKLGIDALGDGETLVVFAASPAIGRAGYVLALTPGPPLPDAVVAAAMEQAHATATNPRSAPFSLTLDRQLEVAKLAIGERNRLGALLALATRLDLPRCIDLLLAADERTLIAITDALPDLAAPGVASTAAWQVERAMWTATLPALQRGEALPALLACTRRQLGAAAIDHGALQLLLASSADAAEFQAGLHEDNLASLDDQDTAPRVRAHDWLSSHGSAVPGYDPLGERTARRSALRARGNGR